LPSVLQFACNFLKEELIQARGRPGWICSCIVWTPNNQSIASNARNPSSLPDLPHVY
jgi:hypothetical protein